jgi:hypothetical protein
MELSSNVGEAHSSGGAPDQRHPQFLFQFLEVRADDSLGQPQSLGCPGEGAGLDHSGEYKQPIEV